MKFMIKKILLIFLILFTPLNTIEKCTREVVEAYGLQSYFSPRSLRLHLFPTIQATCCPIYDQLEMFVNYRDRIKPMLNRYYKQLRIGVKKMTKVIDYIMRMKMKEMIRFFKFSMQQTDMMTFKWDNITRRYKVKKNMRLLRTLQPKAHKFMNDLKKSFYGVICDYDNQQFINIEEKTIDFSLGTCQFIAHNTIDFSYQLNVVMLKIIYDIMAIVDKFTDNTVALKFKLEEYDEIRRAVRQCKTAKRNGNWSNCKKYCSYFNLNSFSPIIEGYRQHFDEMLLVLAGFTAKYQRFKPKKPFTNKYKLKKYRVLQDNSKSKKNQLLIKKNGDDIKQHTSQKLTRILQLLDLNKLRRAMNTESSAINYVKKKRLKLARPFYVPKKFIPHDVYQPTHLDGGDDDAVFGRMATKEFLREKNIHFNYVQFIRNTLFDANAKETFINPEKNLFLELPEKLVGLEDFKTIIGVDGIDLKKILKSTNIGKSYKNLLAGIKTKSPYELDYETMDKVVLHQINDINNNIVKEFHKDNFMKFKNLSYRMKRNQILKKSVADQIAYNKNGYRITG